MVKTLRGILIPILIGLSILAVVGLLGSGLMLYREAHAVHPLLGVLVLLLLVAGGEPEYREAYPDKPALGRVFSRSAFGTKRVFLGLLAGYYENWVSEAIMRVADVFLSIPQIILAIFLAQSLGPSIHSVILALSITYWPWFTRIVFAETRALKKTSFIEATEALGAGRLRTMLLHVLPNVSSPIIVRSSIGMGFTILTAAALGFLGAGAQPPTPEWGVTIAESRQFLPDAWWYATFPGLAIFLVVMGFNMLGDGLRDILDPRIRRGLE